MGNVSSLLENTEKSKHFTDPSLDDFEYAATALEDINDASFGPVRIFKRRDLLLQPMFIMEKSVISN